MRTIRIKLYKFSELSKEAQERAIRNVVLDITPRYFVKQQALLNKDKETAINIINMCDYDFTIGGNRY